MSNPIDTMGRCAVCGKKCESSAGCDCTTISAYGAGSPTTMLAPDAQALIASKDAEILALKLQLEKPGHQLALEAMVYRERAIALKKRAARLESKCAKMRVALTQAKDSLRVGTPEGHKVMVAKIDAILESEE